MQHQMKKFTENPIKFIFALIATFILASIMHNVVYAFTNIEEPFFFTIAVVSALLIPVAIIYSIFLKIRKKSESSENSQ